MSWMKKMLAALALAAFVALPSACGDDKNDGDSDTDANALNGEVVIDGSSTVYPIAEAASDDFYKKFPNVKVTVGVSGTGGGFQRFTKGETDISNASRPIKGNEFEIAKKNGIEFIEVPCSLDGLSIVVNKENTWVEKLTVEDLQKIFLEDGVKNWNELNPAWPDEPIKMYSPGKQSGTYDYFMEVVAGKTKKAFRGDKLMSTSEKDHVLVQGVFGDKFAIGYFGAAYYFENLDKLRAVPIVNPSTGEAVLPEEKNVIDGSYAPFGRPIFFYVNVESLKKPQVREFVNYWIDNGSKFSKQVKYVPLPEEITKRAKDMV
ncbi:MAG: PstS family phosphate ABC transporter substrate-binding protein, partial [Planctomycetes bacterium]|nr:PstS family phosphate ABC transporter substrate-binding protein [Planctomycetota bacterium]